MTEEECREIRRYAGNAYPTAEEKMKVVTICRTELMRISKMRSEEERYTAMNTPEMLFIREVDSVCPDLMLRARYRLALAKMEA